MDASVIVCTRNRAVQLRNALECMKRLIIPNGKTWELVVIDNGSTDDTPQLISSFARDLPIRSFRQGIPGKSNALNLALTKAIGNYFVFTDDDAQVSPVWLSSYFAAFDNFPESVLFGGRVRPALEPPTPSWFAQSLDQIANLVALRDFGDTPTEITLAADNLPFGVNMAVRSIEHREYIYDPELGVAPGRRMGGEEIDLAIRLLRAGHTGWWVPEAVVSHVIPSARQSVEYIKHYYESEGMLLAHKSFEQHHPFLVFGVPLTIWIKLPVTYLKYRVAASVGWKRWVGFLASYAYRLGSVRQWRAMSKERSAMHTRQSFGSPK